MYEWVKVVRVSVGVGGSICGSIYWSICGIGGSITGSICGSRWEWREYLWDREGVSVEVGGSSGCGQSICGSGRAHTLLYGGVHKTCHFEW